MDALSMELMEQAAVFTADAAAEAVEIEGLPVEGGLLVSPFSLTGGGVPPHDG